MKGFIQFFCEGGSFSAPMPDDYEIVRSKKQASQAAKAWFDETAGYTEEPASVLFFLPGIRKAFFLVTATPIIY